jgi:hypothetical protein
MNKRGDIEDIPAILIVTLLLIFLALGLPSLQQSTVKIDSLKQRLNDDLFLINVLRAKVDDNSMENIILSDYSKDDFTETEEGLNKLFIDAFGEQVCWTLLIDGKMVKNSECKKMDDIGDVDAVTYLAGVDSTGKLKRIEVRLKL